MIKALDIATNRAGKLSSGLFGFKDPEKERVTTLLNQVHIKEQSALAAKQTRQQIQHLQESRRLITDFVDTEVNRHNRPNAIKPLIQDFYNRSDRTDFYSILDKKNFKPVKMELEHIDELITTVRNNCSLCTKTKKFISNSIGLLNRIR